MNWLESGANERQQERTSRTYWERGKREHRGKKRPQLGEAPPAAYVEKKGLMALEDQSKKGYRT